MAGLWKLPAIYVCENNSYGMGTSVERASYNTQFHERLHIPGITVDGLNVFAVREAFRFAKEFCPENGPLVMNIKTYRYHGHSMSDPGVTYRTREEVQTMRKESDCILYLKNLLINQEMATVEEVKAVEKDARKEVDDASKRAQAQGDWDESVIFEDIYDDTVNAFIRAPLFEDSLNAPDGVIPK